MSSFFYNFFHYSMTISFFVLSMNVPSTKMKVIGVLLTAVNFLLFLK